MTAQELFVLLPMIVMASVSVLIMLGIAAYRCHSFTAVVTLLGIAAGIASLAVVYPQIPKQVTPLIIVDSYAVLYMALILVSTLVTALLSYGYLKESCVQNEEYYLLLILAALGSTVLVCSSHFASFFLGLEILSVSLYALIAYPKGSTKNIEAGTKYLVIAAASSAFLLFGMALVYAEIGSLSFASIASVIPRYAASSTLLAGMALIIVGIGFKLALVPFHMWTPDIYEGAPAPVTAFVATVSKGAIFALLLRFFWLVDLQRSQSLVLVFTLLSVLSMIGGNILALFQDNVKRILAYSSIAHMGYLLVAFLAGGAFAAQAVTFYIVTYFITTFGAFGIITLLSEAGGEAESIDDYRGMAWRRPWLTSVFTAMLFSLAGIPLTAGFIGKYFIIAAGASSALWMLIVILALSSVIGLFYYLRVILALYALPAGKDFRAWRRLSFAGGLILSVLMLLLVWIGVYPAPLMDGIKLMIGKLG